ncbi:MAG: type VI secretion system baseplate subunit TssF [Burkholderiaceae bacterium]|nr:MAG: type VI secretion system baseplate subunit TssF [Burkholderiaceae bacterium]
MDPRLLDYYNRELGHLRETGAEFAREFPKVAARLGMEGLEVADPYVERLMEGFAFIAARVQLKIDAEFPRFTQHLLEILFPHYLAPTPACMVVEMRPKIGDPALFDGFRMPRGTALRSVVPRGEQTACEFRTAHDLTLWPIEVRAARYFSFAPDLPLGQLGLGGQVRGGLRIRLGLAPGASFDKLRCDALPLFINGPDDLAVPLCELIMSQCIGALLVSADAQPRVLARLRPDQVQADGFADDQALFPFDRRTFEGYRLLREYFAFPQRFQFVRVDGLQAGWRQHAASECELVLLFGRGDAALESRVDESCVALNATPVVNLFPRRADRVHLSEGQFEHHLVIDRTRPLDFEVFSIRSVRGLGNEVNVETTFAPFYGDLVHHDARTASAFYTMRREPRLPSDRQRRQGARSGYAGGEVFLALVDEREAPYPARIRQLAVEVMATNRDLPLLLPIGSLNALMLEDLAPVDQVRVLKGPTRPRPGLAEGDHAWRLLSHLSLNYLGLFDGSASDAGAGAAALRETLLLYADMADPAVRKQVDAVVGLTARPVVRRLPMAGPIVFGRGLSIDVTMREDAFGGAGCYLLGAVLDRFFARHVSINTFTQTRLLAESRGEVARWPARTGTRIVA